MNDAERLELPHVFEQGDPWLDEIRSVHGYYDKSGNKISFRDWVRLNVWDSKNGDAYKRIGLDMVGTYRVSTVWLGLDHGWGGRPLIFETMVFNDAFPDPPPLIETFANLKEAFENADNEDYEPVEYPEFTSATDLDCERYTTEAEAIAGHKAMVEKVRLIVEATQTSE